MATSCLKNDIESKMEKMSKCKKNTRIKTQQMTVINYSGVEKDDDIFE